MMKLAFEYAQEKHKNQVRKGSQIPYMTHIYDVARILINNHAPAHVVVAGILHDTLEDTNATPQEIESLFGKQVLSIVEEETENKSLAWRARKQDRIDHLKTASTECKMVKCADMLANLSDLHQNIKSDGEGIWAFFRGTKQDTMWYYDSMIEVMKELENMQMYVALKKLFAKVFMSSSPSHS